MRHVKPVLIALAFAACSLSGASAALAEAAPLSVADQTAAQALATQIESVVNRAPHDATQGSIQARIRDLIRRSGLNASAVLAALNMAEDVVTNEANPPSFGLAAIQNVDAHLAALVGSPAPAAGGDGGGAAALGAPIVGIGGGGSNYKPG
jgi:hypothetical protein